MTGPVPKVIDIGLAKAIYQSLTKNTLHTAHDMILGTPLYMSPEQAQLNNIDNIDIDTRADIYSLGALLYELLTGSTPLEKQRFKRAAWEEPLLREALEIWREAFPTGHPTIALDLISLRILI